MRVQFALAACVAGFALMVLVAEAGWPAGGRREPGLISSVTFGTPYRYNTPYPTKWGGGDGWQTTWADDDQIYTNFNDTPSGCQGAGTSANQQIAILSDATTSTTCTNRGSMPQWGTMTQYGSDGLTSKLGGIISVGSMLYASNYRGEGCAGSQLLKSADHGLNWTPLPPAGSLGVYTTLMFPGYVLTTFASYGTKAYAGQTADRSGTYVYAVFIPCGAIRVLLGRVLITNIGNQSAADWTYWQGGDGALDANWGAVATAAELLVIDAVSLSVWGVQYLPYFKQYLAFEYSLGNPSPSDTFWHIRAAPHPWGPWSQVAVKEWNPQGLYGPSVVAKSLVTDGGRTLMTAAAGNYTTYADNVNGYYTLWLTPATVQ